MMNAIPQGKPRTENPHAASARRSGKRLVLFACVCAALAASAEITLVDPWNPMRSHAIAERLRQARPFFFAYGPEGVARLRKTVAEDAVLSGKFGKLRERCDQSLSEPVEVPSRGGEWPSWYTCRKCASGLKEREKGVHVCPACGEIHRGVVYDDVVLFGVHQRLQRNIRELGYAFLVSGDRRYAERAKGLLLAYAKAIDTPGYRVHDTQGGASISGGNVYAEILVDACWLVDIIAGYDSVAEMMTEAERRLVEERVIRKIAVRAETCDRDLEKIGNHETWHEAAYGLAGMVLRDPALIGKARVMMYYQLSRGILPNGGWFEGAFDYHFFTMHSVVDFIAALGNVGVDIASDFPVSFRQMFDYPLGLVGPDRILPALNDDKTCLFSRDERDPKISAIVDLYDRSRVWTDRPAIDRETPTQSLAYKEEGLAMLRDGQNAVMLKFGPHGGWHGHFDKLSFILWGNGEVLSEDPGCCGYGNPKHFGWYKNTLSHNTLSADGVRQEAATGRLLAFRRKKGWSAVLADAGEAIPGAKVRRAIALSGDVILDFMTAEAPSERDWEWAFHSRGKFACDVAGSPVKLPSPKVPPEGVRPDVTDGRESWNWTRHVRDGAHGGQWSASWRTDRTTLAVSQKSSAGGVLRVADADGLVMPDGPVPLTVVGNRVRGRCASFATVLSVNGKGDVEIVAMDERGFSARVGDRCCRIVVDGDDVWFLEDSHCAKECEVL